MVSRSLMLLVFFEMEEIDANIALQHPTEKNATSFWPFYERASSLRITADRTQLDEPIHCLK